MFGKFNALFVLYYIIATTSQDAVEAFGSVNSMKKGFVTNTNTFWKNHECRVSSFGLRMEASKSVLEKLPEDDDTPIPFVDKDLNEFIECYADSIATIDGIQYTIGTPCDYPVALCYFDSQEQLIPIELEDELMDDIFPIAESIVEDEFGEELVLQRTSQTLTLMGELDDDEEEDDYDEEEEEDDYDGDEEEEVEILISFEHKGTEYNLVRLLDPVLLVAKPDPENPSKRYLLSEEESDRVMPILEELFLDQEELA